MSFPEIIDHSGLAFSPLHLVDESGQPVLALLGRATFDILSTGALRAVEKHMPINPEGRLRGAPGLSSYRYETDIAPFKAATDIVLNGHACAPARNTVSMDVSLRVGNIFQTIRVFGHRQWVDGVVGKRITAPQPFDHIELSFENAFGGWDRTDADSSRHGFDPRNPVGTGYRNGQSDMSDVKLPNIENPASLITGIRDRPPPAGFGFTSPEWHPRAAFAGTFDDAWMRERSPLLPVDFDRRYFSGAAPGLTATPFLNGNDYVEIRGATPEGLMAFQLPGIAPLDFGVELRSEPRMELVGVLDTVVIDADERQVHLTWRASAAVPRGPQDVMAIEIGRHLDARSRALLKPY